MLVAYVHEVTFTLATAKYGKIKNVKGQWKVFCILPVTAY